jgi:hypothetical protein
MNDPYRTPDAPSTVEFGDFLSERCGQRDDRQIGGRSAVGQKNRGARRQSCQRDANGRIEMSKAKKVAFPSTTEAFVSMARELRRLADEAEDRLFVFLCEGEVHEEIWRPSGLSYLEFIGRANLCRVERFVAYKRIHDGHGADAIAGIGVHGVVAAGSLKTPGEQREVIERVRSWEKTNGTAISAQSAERIARDTKLVELGRHRSKGYTEIVRENEMLREKLRVAEQTIAALRIELRAAKGAKSRKSKAA